MRMTLKGKGLISKYFSDCLRVNRKIRSQFLSIGATTLIRNLQTSRKYHAASIVSNDTPAVQPTIDVKVQKFKLYRTPLTIIRVELWKVLLKRLLSEFWDIWHMDVLYYKWRKIMTSKYGAQVITMSEFHALQI